MWIGFFRGEGEERASLHKGAKTRGKGKGPTIASTRKKEKRPFEKDRNKKADGGPGTGLPRPVPACIWNNTINAAPILPLQQYHQRLWNLATATTPSASLESRLCNITNAFGILSLQQHHQRFSHLVHHNM